MTYEDKASYDSAPPPVRRHDIVFGNSQKSAHSEIYGVKSQ